MTEPIPAHRPWGIATHSLREIINELPDLPQAACKGQPGYWDDWADNDDGQRETTAKRAARHYEARTICDHCPELFECRLQREAHPHWGPGIFGGQYFDAAAPAKDASRTCARPGCNNATAGQAKYCAKKCRQAVYDTKHRERLRVDKARRRAEQKAREVQEAA